MTLPADAFSLYDPARGGWVFEPGDFSVMVGASSRDVRLEGKVTLAQTGQNHPR